MTKQELQEYRHLLAEERQLRDEILVWESRAGCCTRAPDRVPAWGSSDPMPDIVDKLSELRVLLDAKAMEIQARRIRIETAIGGLDSRERRLMRARYVEGKRWEQIAADMGYAWAQVHRLHGIVLKKMIHNDTF